MAKMYMKDSNGKYKLVDRDQKEETKNLVNHSQDSLSVEDRLLRLERIVLDPRK